MNFIGRVVHKPRSFAVRGWLFQIHLWTGIVLALYGVIIGITGSALVFEPEIEDWQARDLLHAARAGKPFSADRILHSVAEQFPQASIGSLFPPAKGVETFRVWLRQPDDNRQHEVFVDPVTTRVLGERIHGEGFLNWLEQLHFNLLGGRTGNIVNGVAALLMLVLSLTGLVSWWPGRAHWIRAISINWSLRWKRVNYDIHSSLGFFTLPFVLVLSLTGAYFSWPQETRDFLARFVPMRQGRTSPALPENFASGRVPIQQLIDTAAGAVPDSWPELVTIPRSANRAVRVYLMSGDIREYHKTSTVDLDPRTGAILLVQPEKGRTIGDAAIAWMSALHFGNFGGTPVKALWTLLGLSPAILSVTGLLMWWNRVLVKKRDHRRTRLQSAGSARHVELTREEVFSFAEGKRR